jgi:hypothetical protein
MLSVMMMLTGLWWLGLRTTLIKRRHCIWVTYTMYELIARNRKSLNRRKLFLCDAFEIYIFCKKKKTSLKCRIYFTIVSRTTIYPIRIASNTFSPHSIHVQLNQSIQYKVFELQLTSSFDANCRHMFSLTQPTNHIPCIVR